MSNTMIKEAAVWRAEFEQVQAYAAAAENRAAKKAALYAMLTQNGTNEIVKANLDNFLAAF